jgi:hypothetical protein
MTLTLVITAGDIAKGKSCSPTECPLALAFMRQLGEPVRVTQYLVFWRNLNEELAELPQKLQQFVDDFDNGRPVKPCRVRVAVGQ